MKTLEVLFTPADFGALKQRNLEAATCVVFDVFRATTSMITALASGASAILPVGEIPEALAARERDASILLAGEREGLRIRAGISGGVDFDLGNSPREFIREKVSGKTIAITTTNGTRALRACAHAQVILAGSFLNLRATAEFLRRASPMNVVVVCSGTFEQFAYEDVLGAGALCDLLWADCDPAGVADSAVAARRLFQMAGSHLAEAAAQSRNGRRLSANPDLRDDVPFCLQRDTCTFAAVLQGDGMIRAV